MSTYHPQDLAPSAPETTRAASCGEGSIAPAWLRSVFSTCWLKEFTQLVHFFKSWHLPRAVQSKSRATSV